MENFRDVNILLLATLTDAFFKSNGITNVTPELADMFANGLFAMFDKWYEDNDKVMSLETAVIEADAVEFAFSHADEILTTCLMLMLFQVGGIRTADAEIE